MSTASTNFGARLAINLFIVIAITLIVYTGRDILIPLGFSIMLAMLLLPVVNGLVKRKVPNSLAIIIALVIAILFVAGIIYFLSAQIASFTEDLPAIKQKLHQHWTTIQNWLNEAFGISKQQQDQAIDNAKENAKSSGTSGMGILVTGIASGLATMILLPIYTFLILFYRKLIRQFMIDVFASAKKEQVEEVLAESNTIVRAYMLGLIIEMAIVTVLNAVGFFVIGIQYAIFLAVLAAILNMIPYIGMLVATVICMAVTLTSADTFSAVAWTGVVLIIVQFIDNNLIMPYIVGSKVRINALFSIVGVLIGGAIAGVAGMFLSIPVIAIMKAVFDRIDSLKPWGMLLGDPGTKKDKK